MPRLLLAAAVLAGLAHPSAAAEPVPIASQVLLHIEVQADGEYTETLHLVRRAGSDTAARDIANFSWDYSPSHEQVEVVSASTLKADGRGVPVDSTTIHDVVSNPSWARFTDLREKVIPFIGVNAGDSIDITLRDRVFHPLLPGVFALALMYAPTQAWDDVRVTITVPGSLKLLTDAVGLEPSQVGDGASVTYAWRYRNTNVLPEDVAMLAPIARLPRLLVTTATSWQQIGRYYAAIALKQTAVTAQVRETADAATAGLTDRRAMAEHLFDWVSDHVRYVAVPLGAGRIVPYAANTVLTDHAGDSADQAVLLSALLAAKGIPSELALIDTNNLYRLSIPVPFAQLNHVILYLPEFGIYVDPTAGSAPFGVLPFTEYGKPVVYAVGSGKAVGSTPILAPGAASMNLQTTAHITADDMIVGSSRTEATGPFSVSLRLEAGAIASMGSAFAANDQLSALGEIGTGEFDPPTADPGDGAYSLSGQFAVSAWPRISANDGLSMPDGLRVLPRVGELLIGPLNVVTLPDSEPTPCYAGRQAETVSLDVGPKYHVARLPADRTIANDAFSYASHWSLQGQTVTVRRELVSRVTQPLCTGKLRTEAAQALRAIRQDYAQRVKLAE